MMRVICFARRNTKEIMRDPMSLIFAVALPLVLLFIFANFDIPSEVYALENFTPGTLIFGLSFVTMFCAVLVAKDRHSSLLARLALSPMSAFDYVAGYVLSLLPLVLLQVVLFFSEALLLGLSFSVGIIFAALAVLPISILFIVLGILIGSVTTERSASGVASIVVQLVAFTSGMYFDGNMMGAFFARLCDALPFSHALNICKAMLSGVMGGTILSVLVLLLYTSLVGGVCVWVFGKKRYAA